ncbi:ABC transporter permease [Rhizomonospora bruguierae]|uniref:ABC transporter permease n=1 Tax=Rhizomonospora bruguierae TaxID=1581705 RepID=UPI001BCEA2D3|nr:ABC transporter permease [Micromonospora sp. NBRC 107566]
MTDTMPTPIQPHPTPRSVLRRVPPIVTVASAVAVVLLLWAVLVPLLNPADATAVDPARRFTPPGPDALLGTDHLGRDLASMIAVGLRTSILMALTVVAVSGALGWLVGAVGGYVGGVTDNVLGRLMDVFNAFPGIILAIALVTVLSPSYSALVLVLVLVTWVNYGRVIRARVLSLRREEYITASRMYGTSLGRILGRHVLPNTGDLLLSISLVQIPNVMLAESTISFLGFGLQPPQVSLGLLISSEKDYLQTNAMPVLVAGAVLVLACTSIATIGLYLRGKER